MPDTVPHAIRLLAEERARARRARDWATADRIRAELEAAGWAVVDSGTRFALRALPPATVEADGEVRYGRSDAVPSLLGEPPDLAASVVIVAGGGEGLLPDAVRGVRAHSPGAQLIVVADAPPDAVAAEVGALGDVEVVWLARRLGAAAARNAGIRRARGRVVVLLDPRVVAGADLAGALTAALDDPTVAIAGLRGLATDDLVRFAPAPDGAGDVVAVDVLAMAFRRADYVARGPLDEAFLLDDYLGAWWSLVLRDALPDAGPAEAPAAHRRAVAVVVPHTLRDGGAAPADERLARRQRYRFLKSFATRRDLLRPTQG